MITTETKQVLIVLGTHHTRMDYLATELKSRFGRMNCTGIVHTYNLNPDKPLTNQDLDVSNVGKDPDDALHIWVIDGDTSIEASPWDNHSPRGCFVDVKCKSRSRRFDNSAPYEPVLHLDCKKLCTFKNSKKPIKAFEYWAEYYRNKLGVVVSAVVRLRGDDPKTVVICDIDTNLYELLKHK